MTHYTIILLRPDGGRRHIDVEAPNDAAAVLAANTLLKAEPAGATAEVFRWPSPAVH